MASRFKKAVRTKARLRMAIDGPSGSGKSYTALRFAFAFEGARVACIEAGENGGLVLYQGMKPDGVPFEFDVLELKHDFSPTNYTAAIKEAGDAGYDVLVIDSLSHAWAGEGGALDIKDRQGGNEFAAWRTVTPMHNKMIDAILSSPCHVFATMRSKQEYVLEANEKGKLVPIKKAMAPIQRAGMEYEFTIYGSMDHAHILTVTKSRCPAAQDAVVSKPGSGFMAPILGWLETGEVPPAVELPKRVGEEQAGRIMAMIRELNINEASLKASLAKYGAASVGSLLTSQADEIQGKLSEAVQARRMKAAAAAGAVPAATTTAPAAGVSSNGNGGESSN